MTSSFTGNFMDRYGGGSAGGWGVSAWDKAIADGYSPFQIKTAIQRAHRAVGTPVGALLRATRMRGVADLNDGASQFQGGSGDIGYAGYMQAKASGWTPDEIVAGGAEKGMILRERAQAQYELDKKNEAERDHQLNYMRQLTEMMNKPEPQVGRSVDYSVGKGGASSLKAEDVAKPKKERRGTNQWRRDLFANNVNLGTAASGSGGGNNQGPVNTAS